MSKELGKEATHAFNAKLRALIYCVSKLQAWINTSWRRRISLCFTMVPKGFQKKECWWNSHNQKY